MSEPGGPALCSKCRTPCERRYVMQGKDVCPACWVPPKVQQSSNADAEWWDEQMHQRDHAAGSRF